MSGIKGKTSQGREWEMSIGALILVRLTVCPFGLANSEPGMTSSSGYVIFFHSILFQPSLVHRFLPAQTMATEF